MALTVSSAPPPTQEAVRYRPSKAMTALFPVPSIWDHVVGDVPLRPGETQPAFVPHNVLENSFNVALVGTAAGVYAAFYQNSADPILHGGATAVLGRSVATVGIFAAVGPTFVIARGLSANIRQKDDWINGGIGGIAMGTLFGLRTGSAWSTFCYAFFLGGGASIWGYTNGIGRYEHVLSGGRNVYEREQDAAKLAGRRIPLDQVSPPPGEGYGIYPGYDRSYTRKGPRTEDGGLYTPGRTVQGA